jgi:hypothetical protein
MPCLGKDGGSSHLYVREVDHRMLLGRSPFLEVVEGLTNESWVGSPECRLLGVEARLVEGQRHQRVVREIRDGVSSA